MQANIFVYVLCLLCRLIFFPICDSEINVVLSADNICLLMVHFFLGIVHGGTEEIWHVQWSVQCGRRPLAKYFHN